MTRARQLVAELQMELGLSIACGQITLNINDHDLQSYETRTFARVTSERRVGERRGSERTIDKRERSRADLTRLVDSRTSPRG